MGDPVLVGVVVVGLGAAAGTIGVAWHSREDLAGDWRWLRQWVRDRFRPTHHDGATVDWSPKEEYAAVEIAASPLLATVPSKYELSRARLAAAIAAQKSRVRALCTPTMAMFVQTLEQAGEEAPDTFGPREWWTIGDRRQDQPAPVPPRRPTPQRPTGVYQLALFEDAK